MTTYYTLADYAKLADRTKNDLFGGVVDTMIVNSPLMSAISFATTGGLDTEAIRTLALPTVGTRKIGGTWSNTKGTYDVTTERVVNLGAKIDIDKVLVKANSIVDQRATQVDLFTKAIALKFNKLLIAGEPTAEADYDSLTGIRYRLINDLGSGQSINASGLDVSADSSALAASQLKLIDHIHDMLSMMPGGCDWLVMNRNCKLRLEAALRDTSMLDTTQDNYARTFKTFGAGGPKILDIGTPDPLNLTVGASNYIITNTEADDGSAVTGGDATTIYGIKIGKEFLGGFQTYPLDVVDKGLLENGVTYSTVIDWPVGLTLTNPFSVARVHGVVAA